MYNFTLIIPTHNRHYYLERSIEYFKNLDAYVIYCDSSESSYSTNFCSNIIYLHLPNETFADKILTALNKATTDYIALCADDDFILMESLYKGIDILEKSSTYKTVIGNIICFHENFDGHFYENGLQPSYEINYSPTENVLSFFSNYQQILWGMYSKKILRKSFEIIKNSNFENDNFIELTIGAIACYSGGIKFLNNIWGIRELSAKEHWGDKHPNLNNFYQNKLIQNDYKKFKIFLDNHTHEGYAYLVFNTYCKINLIQKYKQLLKLIIKTIIPKRLLNRLLRSNKNNLTNNSFVKYQNYHKFTPQHYDTLIVITDLLKNK